MRGDAAQIQLPLARTGLKSLPQRLAQGRRAFALERYDAGEDVDGRLGGVRTAGVRNRKTRPVKPADARHLLLRQVDKPCIDCLLGFEHGIYALGRDRLWENTSAAVPTGTSRSKPE
jgi:hypothetical protein